MKRGRWKSEHVLAFAWVLTSFKRSETSQSLNWLIAGCTASETRGEDGGTDRQADRQTVRAKDRLAAWPAISFHLQKVICTLSPLFLPPNNIEYNQADRAARVLHLHMEICAY